MTPFGARRLTLRLIVLVAVVLSTWSTSPAARVTFDLPARISDQDFWRLTEELSEPNGFFRSDNLLSNEVVFSRVVPELVSRTQPGGVYLGVGPEQNFTYMAAIKPKLAVIIDIRRGNLLLQLMYKALFELSADRAEFVSLLFTKPRPATLTRESTVHEMMTAYWDAVTSDESVYVKNLQAIKDLLVKKHGFPLSSEDLSGIEYVYHSFYWFGPSITWSSTPNGAQGGRATYRDLMTQTDANERALSYLATEEKFAFLKDLESRNLVVPVVGNFGGQKAIRAVGAYLKERGGTVTAFYVSNVEQYLRQDGLQQAFCENVAALPLDDQSVFIRPSGPGRGMTSTMLVVNGVVRSVTSMTGGGGPVTQIVPEVKSCAAGSRFVPAPR